MISDLALSLVFAGALILAGALVPVRRLIGKLPPGLVRSRWHMMTALIMVFFFGYLAYAVAFWNSHSKLLDLIVPYVFFLGACFVWLTAILSLQTTVDVMRMNLLEREVVTDPLTGTYNRRYLDRRLNEEVLIERRYGRPLSVFLLDIDHFKQINDTYGHHAGDQVLTAFGGIVAEALRETDVLARYGGEEFLVIAPQTLIAGATELAERVRRNIEVHPFTFSEGSDRLRQINVTISIGVAGLGNGIDSTHKLVRAADAALYRAKQEGRNRVICATVPTVNDKETDGRTAGDVNNPIPISGTK